MNQKKEKIQLVPYTPEYRDVFKELNEAWIRQYFKMEDKDHESLDHPEETILDKGGHIIVALWNGRPVGVCALIKSEHPKYPYELAKMGVAPEARGKGIGYRLGMAIIENAKELGAKSLFLESNTLLKPAISLYKKLGFIEIQGYTSPYERSNIQMLLELD
ncbi:MAG: GNAT family N-acetyltransferase [Bacteroidia bacterium]|nr:GNAT family N-acetyltransferase [Bacteroidia bacterium]